MARKNVFELIEQTYGFENDTRRLLQYFEEEEMLEAMDGDEEDEYCPLIEGVNDYFCSWIARGRCIDLNDYLVSIHYTELRRLAGLNLESFLTLIEVIYNLWYIVEREKQRSTKFGLYSTHNELKWLMDECLSQYNHKAYYIKKDEKVLVVEDKPEATAVAEIVESDLALEVIRYNHHSLKGDVNAKRSILNRLGTELEPKRKELKAVNSTLEDQVFFMLNNMNIRHNNIKTGDGNYREAVAQMPETELEQWYDELYQMILLAMLQMDNVDRTAKVKMLKDKITAK